jgi:multimeric flavodoxin WrbA
MTAKALGIAGSARHEGNSELLLDRALAGAGDAGAVTEKVVLLDLDMSPCICPTSEDCQPEGICSIEDDMQILYPKLLACDLLFVASPIFFHSVSGQLKAMIDRCQALWVRKYKLKQDITPHRASRRSGLFISVGAEKGGHEFRGALPSVRALFVTLNVRYTADLLLSGIVRQGDVAKHPEYLDQAYELGRRLVREDLSNREYDAQ